MGTGESLMLFLQGPPGPFRGAAVFRFSLSNSQSLPLRLYVG